MGEGRVFVVLISRGGGDVCSTNFNVVEETSICSTNFNVVEETSICSTNFNVVEEKNYLY